MGVWDPEANAIVRLKVDEAVLQQRAPLLTEIVRQGIREGIFTTANPDYAGEVLLSLLQSMGNTHARVLLSFKQEHDDLRCIEGIVATHAAYMDAIERVCDATPHSFSRTSSEALNGW